MKNGKNDDDIVVRFPPEDLPAGTGIRAALRQFLQEHKSLFSKVVFHADGDDMTVVATPHESLTTGERNAIMADIKEAIQILAQLTRLQHIR